MSDTRPNILLITTDQQRGDCLGLDPNGPECLQTPNLDWIGRTGTHFRRGYAEGPTGCYHYNHGNHYVTDGEHKYVWYSQTGREHLFNLRDDPHETHDLAGSETLLTPWRNRLIEFLRPRSEGFTDGTNLIAGQRHDALLPDYQPDATYSYF